MLAILLAMLETEEDRERFLKLHGAYEKKLYAVAARQMVAALVEHDQLSGADIAELKALLDILGGEGGS